ncbi:unnamed protein product [Auanema sp. JU1783]|nr:unnamed protein product [Auanema sp. JU1783]
MGDREMDRVFGIQLHIATGLLFGSIWSANQGLPLPAHILHAGIHVYIYFASPIHRYFDEYDNDLVDWD